MMCPWRTILCGWGGGMSMGRLSPMYSRVSESLFPCMSSSSWNVAALPRSRYPGVHLTVKWLRCGSRGPSSLGPLLHPRLQTSENRWLGYTQQIYHHALHWTQRLDMQDHAQMTKDDRYFAPPTPTVPA